jgi:flagellar hook protein FlgE
MPLIGTLSSGVSALRTFSKGLEVIGGNIANVNTTGYKSSSTSFSDTFSNTVGTAGGAAQIGSGVQVGGIATNFAQGSLSSTSKPTDLGIAGKGYFVVQDGTARFATRDGGFHFDSNGYLVNAQGKSVMSAANAPIQVPTFGNVTNISVGLDGTITAFYNDGTTDTSQQIGLITVDDQTKLVKQANNLYDYSAVSTTIPIPGAPTAGTNIQAGALEQSNVDLTDQFAELITTQRSFQAASRLVTVSDSVLEDIVNLKRN